MSTGNDIEFIKLNVQGRIENIKQAMLKDDPQLPTHLAAIHSALIQYEELVHLLSDEEIKTLIDGQKKHMNVSFVKEVTEKKTRVKVPKATADDF